jgi:hypothetical protein
MPTYRTRPSRQPQDTQATLELRARWFAGNTPSKPDWASNAVQCKAAYDCMRERRAV